MYYYLTKDASIELFWVWMLVSFIVWIQKTSIFRRKTVIHTLQQHKLIVHSAKVHKNPNISWQVLWNWLMLVLNHKNLLSLLRSLKWESCSCKTVFNRPANKNRAAGITAKCYLKSTCLTLKLNPKSALPMDRKKCRACWFVTGHTNACHGSDVTALFSVTF